MKKVFSRRPSAGAVIGFIALCVALGGGAYAASKGKKVEYKGLSKDARVKVLPVDATNAGRTITTTDRVVFEFRDGLIIDARVLSEDQAEVDAFWAD